MNKEYLEKVQTIDGIITATYDAMGGEPGDARDWDLYRFLYHPNGQMIRYEDDFVDGELRPQFMSPDDFISSIGKWIQSIRKTGFYEREIHRITKVFGNTAHVWSTCESFHSKSDMKENKPYVRNVHTVQLAYYKERWWVLSMYWSRETDEFPIPKEFLE